MLTEWWSEGLIDGAVKSWSEVYTKDLYAQRLVVNITDSQGR